MDLENMKLYKYAPSGWKEVRDGFIIFMSANLIDLCLIINKDFGWTTGP